jgi:Tc5 transposase DNA-binding domain
LTAQCNEILDFQQKLTQLDQLYCKMPVTCAEIEELVIKACEDLQTQETPKIAATARKYNAPKDRVYRRWNGLSRSRIDAGGANKALDDAAEEALCLYIEFADDLGIPIREKTLVKAANSILRNHHVGDNPPRTVSNKWPSRWLKRHPEF